MALLVVGDGCLRKAITDQLSENDVGWAAAAADREDLFSEAVGHPAIIYGPAASLLDGRQQPRPSVDRIERVLHAAEAPGVEVIVLVLPEGEGYRAEIDAVARYGKPYVVLRAPLLIEEVAEELRAERRGSVWLPRLGQVSVGGATAVAEAVVAATGTDEQGRVIDLPGDEMDAAMLVHRAAERAGIGLRVHALRAWVYRIVRPVLRWLSPRHSIVYRLASRLFPELSDQEPSGLLPAGG
jgi:hypothetical protein